MRFKTGWVRQVFIVIGLFDFSFMLLATTDPIHTILDAAYRQYGLRPDHFDVMLFDGDTAFVAVISGAIGVVVAIVGCCIYFGAALIIERLRRRFTETDFIQEA